MTSNVTTIQGRGKTNRWPGSKATKNPDRRQLLFPVLSVQEQNCKDATFWIAKGFTANQVDTDKRKHATYFPIVLLHRQTLSCGFNSPTFETLKPEEFQDVRVSTFLMTKNP